MGPKIIHKLALVKFVPAAAAYHFCLTSPATISQPWSYNFSVSNWEWIWLSVLYVLFAFLHESSPFLPLLDATSETAIAPPTEGGEESEDSHVKTHQELPMISIHRAYFTYIWAHKYKNAFSLEQHHITNLPIKRNAYPQSQERWVRRSLVGLACPLIRVAPKKLEGILGFEITPSSDSSSISILTYLDWSGNNPTFFRRSFCSRS